MNMPEAQRPADRLRASDADRDAVVAGLSEHYQAGRLSTDELEDRTGAALSARTYGDLRGLTADLPGPAAPARPAPAAQPASRPGRAGGYLVGVAVLAAALIIGGAVGLLGPGHHGTGAWAVVPVVLIIARIARIASRGDRQQQHSGRG